MSAFRVSRAHINAILALARPIHEHHSFSYYWNDAMHQYPGDEQRIGQALLNENYRSVDCRYNEDTPVPTFSWQPVPLQRHGVPGLAMACHSYQYQSCEAPGWKESEAYAIVQALLKRAWRFLPEYEAANTWRI